MRYFITAGETSGDIYGGLLMAELKAMDSEAEFFGFGGPFMCEQGMQSIAPIEKLAVMGFVEVAKQYRFFRQLLKEAKELMSNSKIDRYIPIDYPGFNLRLADHARSLGIPVAYYIVPQLWAWGKNRAKKVRKIDKLLPIFPFEVDFYKKQGIDAETPGAPILDLPDFQKEILPISKRKNQISIMAGSRRSELDKHLPILEKTIEIIHRKQPEIQFATATTSDYAHNRVSEIFPKTAVLKHYQNSREMLAESRFGIIKSGTSNLEAALMGIPFVMIYKLSIISAIIINQISNTKYYSIVNILTGNETIKEMTQLELKPHILSSYALDFYNDNSKLEAMQTELLGLRKLLGGGCASKKAAKIIKNM